MGQGSTFWFKLPLRLDYAFQALGRRDRGGKRSRSGSTFWFTLPLRLASACMRWRDYCARQVISTRTGISFLTGIVRNEGGSILKSENVAGMVPEIRASFPCFDAFKRNLLVVRRLTGKLDLQIGVDRRRGQGVFGQTEADGDQRELRAAGHLQHVQVAVAVPRIEGLHRGRNQEIALSGMANALPARRMTDAVGVMQGMRYMISEGGFVQNPLACPLPSAAQNPQSQQRFPRHGLPRI